MMTKPSVPCRYIDRLPSAVRKQFPMCTGFVDYFPDAMAAVSHVSWVGNEKHNPGQPLHHARGKSMDHADCDVRHQSTRHDLDPAYADDVIAPVFHLAEHAWRAMAQLQEAMEKIYGLPLAPAARDPIAAPFGAPELTAAQRSGIRETYDQLGQEPPRCEYHAGVRCALPLGHEGPHRGPVAVNHTCAIGSSAPCVACELEQRQIEDSMRGESTPLNTPNSVSFDPTD